jgi:hypothetical protein
MGRPGTKVIPVFGPSALARRSLPALFAGLLLATPCFAGEPPVLLGKGFTLFAGYQFGGSFTDQTSGQSVQLREGGSFGASLDFPLDDSSELQIFYNHQSTEFTPWPYPNSSAQLRLDYLHIGGTYFPDELGHGVYVVGGLGATRMTPDAAGFDPATRISMNLGIGYLLPLSKNVGVRFEARGFATAIGSNVAVFCSGGCVAKLTASAVTQGDFLIGISARFN